MKVAPIIAAINKHNHELKAGASTQPKAARPEAVQHVLVHTGQHYGPMSDSFFADLDLPEPDVHLGVGSGSHAIQTAEIMRRFEEVLLQERPDVLVVVGDVNSTVACALVAAKISFDACGTRPIIAHVEAGLRSFDRTMPEEINRILTDHLSDLLFVTEQSGLRNLASEGILTDKIHLVGNTMIDSLLTHKRTAESSRILQALGLRAHDDSTQSTAPYALLTLHRPANVDSREDLFAILAGLEEVARECPVIFPAHPRTQKRLQEYGVVHGLTDTIRVIDPLGYIDFLCLMAHASVVITDSGGIQEETTCLGIPCVTVRENTERPVTLEDGSNVLAGTATNTIRAAIRQQLVRPASGAVPALWDGHSAERIVNLLLNAYRPPGTDITRAVNSQRTRC